MHTYQIDTSISASGVISLPEMPYLYNKKVKLIIISSEDNSTEINQRKQAMERLLERQNISHWTDEELNNIRYECLKEKYQ
jgi:hypothetical protein